MVDISYQVVFTNGTVVIESIPAGIVAKLFIGAAADRFFAPMAISRDGNVVHFFY